MKKSKYSQSEEEYHILKYFGDFKGRFLCLGANDGITLSNTRALAELGWSGDLVECSPQAFARLVANYDPDNHPKGVTGSIKCHQLALAEQTGEFMLYESGELLGKGDVALVSSMIKEEVDRFPDVERKRVMVKAYSWNDFYSSIGRPKFDFISSDIEGCDLDVLKQMDLEEIGVKALVIEWNSKPEVKAEIEALMKGFKIIYTSSENLLFAK